VVIPDPVLKRLCKAGVRQMVEVGLQVRLLDVEEAVRRVVRAAVRHDVICGETALAARGDEDDHGLRRCVLHDGKVRRLGHRDHERREVRYGEALNMHVQFERPRAR
jgi:hypothetical protein